MTRSRLDLMAVMLALVAGCDNPAGAFPAELGGLVGQWHWVRSCCGFAGDEIAPDPNKPAISVRFGQDGRVYVLAGNEIVREATVTVRQGWSHQPESDVTVLRYDPPLELVPGSPLANEQTVLSLGSDTLELLSNCFDCHGLWTFVRIGD